MSECSAVVRLQVVHPVPAFLFESFLKKVVAKTLIYNAIGIGINLIEWSLGSPFKKNGWV